MENTWRVLSVKPHWAWAIIHGRKRIENRTWNTPYRGIILIHASSRRPPRHVAELVDGLPPVADLECGAIIGAAVLSDIVPIGAVKGQPFAIGPLCWLFDRVIALPPHRMPGKLSLFSLKLPAGVDATYRKRLQIVKDR